MQMKSRNSQRVGYALTFPAAQLHCHLIVNIAYSPDLSSSLNHRMGLGAGRMGN